MWPQSRAGAATGVSRTGAASAAVGEDLAACSFQERDCGICGKRIIHGFGVCLAAKSHGCPLPSLGDWPFHVKRVDCRLSVLEVTFAATATSKIAVKTNPFCVWMHWLRTMDEGK